MRKRINIKKCWYALRVTYSRELAFKAYLDQHNIENFIPMRYVVIVKNDQQTRKLVPAVHNLIFVHTSRNVIDDIKKAHSLTMPVRYMMNRETNSPIIIPEIEMKHFIAVAGNHEQQVVYLPTVESPVKKGSRVRITGGVFEGVEGLFLRVKGDRRVVVSIQGVMAVATAFIHPSLLERIPENQSGLLSDQ